MELSRSHIRRIIPAALMAFAAFVNHAFGQDVSPRGAGSAALTVQVGLLRSDGGMSPVSSATIYVMYGSVTSGPAQESSIETAGAQFRMRIKKLLSEDRELKNLEKRNRKGDNSDINNTMSALALRDLDEALAATRDWIAHHPDSAWQLRTVTLDPAMRGEWTITALDPGPYEIIVRGRYAQYDVDWEANASLRSEMTLTLPLNSPRFIARADK